LVVPTADKRRCTDCSATTPVEIVCSVSCIVVPLGACVPTGSVTVPDEPATLGSAIVCDAFAFAETALDDVAHVAGAHDGAGVAVGAGVATGDGVPLPPPQPASNKMSPSAEARTR
jgi:hypothetical protein